MQKKNNSRGNTKYTATGCKPTNTLAISGTILDHILYQTELPEGPDFILRCWIGDISQDTL